MIRRSVGRRNSFTAACLLGVVATCLGCTVAEAQPTPRDVVRDYAARTYEVEGGRNFRPISARTTLPDGRGGTITAVQALARPSADAKGRIIMFFRGRRFLGWDFSHEALANSAPRVRDGAFVVDYAVYGRRDPLCCPSGEVTIRFRWTGSSIAASRDLPRGARGSRLELR